MSDLRRQLNIIKQQIGALKAAIPMETVRREVGEHYAKELDGFTDSEAIDHLTSVDDSRVTGAYLIISQRLDPDTLTAICLDYLGRPGRNTRLTGAFGLGSCLKRTQNRKACQALAQMVRNTEEDAEIRMAAYASLQLINWGRPSDSAPGSARTDSGLSQAIDWGLVDSFLQPEKRRHH